MSEPVSNAEIEDVLSSIRRLVSENAGNARASASEGATAEKLVLTPAFRVLTGADVEPHKKRLDPQVEDEVAEAPQEEPEDVLLEEAVWEDTPPQDTQIQDEPVAHLEPVSDQDTGTQGESPAGLEQKIAELEAAIEGTFEEWEPDGSEEETDSAEPFVIQQATPAHNGTVMPPEEEFVVEGSAENVSDAHGEGNLREEPEDAEEVEEAEAQAPSDLDDDEDQDEEAGYLDEDALREMVVQIVREELQGRVGQRITRSVRRMVRREIKRVMAVQELE